VCDVERLVLVRARARQPRIEDLLDASATEHGGRPADVVSLRMGQHEDVDALDAEMTEELVDVRLGRALVDENGALGNLEQDSVALTDVEERDPESLRRR
jgi:hypothetical protein